MLRLILAISCALCTAFASIALVSGWWSINFEVTDSSQNYSTAYVDFGLTSVSWCSNLPFNANTDLYNLNQFSQYVEQNDCGSASYDQLAKDSVSTISAMDSTMFLEYVLTIVQIVLSAVLFVPICLSAFSDRVSKICDRWYLRFLFGLFFYAIWMHSLLMMTLSVRIPETAGNIYVDFLEGTAKNRFPWYTCDGIFVNLAGQRCEGESLSCRKFWHNWIFDTCEETKFYTPSRFAFSLQAVTLRTSASAGWYWQLAVQIVSSFALVLYILYEQVLFSGKIENLRSQLMRFTNRITEGLCPTDDTNSIKREEQVELSRRSSEKSKSLKTA
jgi:hypothetical protein